MVLTQMYFQGVGRKSIEEHTTTSKDDEEAKLNAVKDQVKIISRSLFFFCKGGEGGLAIFSYHSLFLVIVNLEDLIVSRYFKSHNLVYFVKYYLHYP